MDRVERTAGWLIVLLLVTGSLSAPPAAGQTRDVTPALSARPDLSSDGVYQLQWLAGADVLVIEEAPTGRFDRPTELYRGRDHATVVTGRGDGDYHYRLRRAGSPATLAQTVVRVRHHPLGRALGFFGAGLFVFLATVWLVVRGPEDTPPAPERGAP